MLQLYGSQMHSFKDRSAVELEIAAPSCLSGYCAAEVLDSSNDRCCLAAKSDT